VGQTQADLAARRAVAPWYRHKHHVFIDDMITAFRRACITEVTAGPAHAEIIVGGGVTCEATAA